MPGDNNPQGWGSYERLVLAKLEELSDDIKELRTEVAEEFKEISKEQTRQDVAIAMLNVKSGVWGAMAGLVTVAIYIGYSLLGGTNL